MKMPGNMQAMMKQAQQMQQKMQEEIAAIRVEASAGGGIRHDGPQRGPLRLAAEEHRSIVRPIARDREIPDAIDVSPVLASPVSGTTEQKGESHASYDRNNSRRNGGHRARRVHGGGRLAQPARAQLGRDPRPRLRTP